MTERLRAARWGDNDRYLGPFTWATDSSWKHWAVVLRSRGDDDVESGQCTLRFTLRHTTLIIVLPGIVRPWCEKIYPGWDDATVKRLGRDWYWKIDAREYGFRYSDGHLAIPHGRQTHDSSTDKTWSCFLPWTQWRHIRRSLLDLEGKHFWTEWDWIEESYRKRGDLQGERWKLRQSWEEMCPTARFTINDFDGEEIIATTRIEQREWRFGTGWFKWLSWFRRPKIRTSLDISFSAETGPEKGSWKGGTVGTGIEMLPGELHEAAFRRYCDEEHRSKYRKYRVTFLSVLTEATTP